MSLSISPSVAFMPSIFYDRNHNPLNIPCEGPKVVPLFLDPDTSDDGIFIINFTQLFTSGQLSALQSMTVDLASLGNISARSLTVEFAGTGQIITFGANEYPLANGTQTVPICCLNPPSIKVDLSAYNGFGGIQFGIQFYNYINPSFVTYISGQQPA